jgi:hypothetical protein
MTYVSNRETKEKMMVKKQQNEKPEWLVEASKRVPAFRVNWKLENANDIWIELHHGWINLFRSEAYEMSYPMANGKRSREARFLTGKDWGNVAEQCNVIYTQRANARPESEFARCIRNAFVGNESHCWENEQ